MKKTMLLVTLALLLASSSFAASCSKCGYKAGDESVFCSKCGTKLDGSAANDSKHSETDTLALIDDKFSPVNDFEIFVYSSNYLTCVAKFPEFQILFNKNIKDIEEIEKTAGKRDKQIIAYYYRKWEILKTLQDVWSSNIGTNIRKQAYMVKFAGVLKYINEIIAKLKVGISDPDLKALETKLNVLLKVYKVTSRYILVNDFRLPKQQEIGIEEIQEDKVKVIHLGDWFESVVLTGSVETSVENLTSPISGWVSKEEFKKRTDGAELD